TLERPRSAGRLSPSTAMAALRQTPAARPASADGSPRNCGLEQRNKQLGNALSTPIIWLHCDKAKGMGAVDCRNLYLFDGLLRLVPAGPPERAKGGVPAAGGRATARARTRSVSP